MTRGPVGLDSSSRLCILNHSLRRILHLPGLPAEDGPLPGQPPVIAGQARRICRGPGGTEPRRRLGWRRPPHPPRGLPLAHRYPSRSRNSCTPCPSESSTGLPTRGPGSQSRSEPRAAARPSASAPVENTRRIGCGCGHVLHIGRVRPSRRHILEGSAFAARIVERKPGEAAFGDHDQGYAEGRYMKP